MSGDDPLLRFEQRLPEALQGVPVGRSTDRIGRLDVLRPTGVDQGAIDIGHIRGVCQQPVEEPRSGRRLVVAGKLQRPDLVQCPVENLMSRRRPRPAPYRHGRGTPDRSKTSHPRSEARSTAGTRDPRRCRRPRNARGPRAGRYRPAPKASAGARTTRPAATREAREGSFRSRRATPSRGGARASSPAYGRTPPAGPPVPARSGGRGAESRDGDQGLSRRKYNRLRTKVPCRTHPATSHWLQLHCRRQDATS